MGLEGWGGQKSCEAASGSELIFQIYLSGNGLEPSEPLQMALGELEWVGVRLSVIIIHHCVCVCVLPVCQPFSFPLCFFFFFKSYPPYYDLSTCSLNTGATRNTGGFEWYRK